MANLYKIKADVWFVVSANSEDEAQDQADDRLETANDYFDGYEVASVDNVGVDDSYDA